MNDLYQLFTQENLSTGNNDFVKKGSVKVIINGAEKCYGSNMEVLKEAAYSPSASVLRLKVYRDKGAMEHYDTLYIKVGSQDSFEVIDGKKTRTDD